MEDNFEIYRIYMRIRGIPEKTEYLELSDIAKKENTEHEESTE